VRAGLELVWSVRNRAKISVRTPTIQSGRIAGGNSLNATRTRFTCLFVAFSAQRLGRVAVGENSAGGIPKSMEKIGHLGVDIVSETRFHSFSSTITFELLRGRETRGNAALWRLPPALAVAYGVSFRR
jgi:hypothetical protein